VGLLDAGPSTTGRAVAAGRLAWAGPLTVLTAIAAAHAVRRLVIGLLHIRPDAMAFGVVPVTVDAAVLCTLAVIVFGFLSAFHDDPIRWFRWIALGALLVSFLPIILTPEIGNVPIRLGVAAMHVAAYVPCVTLLPWAVQPTTPILDPHA
jgi:hypothetical protein